MEQIFFVRIVAAILYIIILGISITNVVYAVITGKTKQWMRGSTAKQREKWKNNLENNTLIFTKKDNPKEYWDTIIIRAIMVVAELAIGFFIYKKLF